MVYEFAVDPAALSTWDNFRFIISHCGVEHGRLISKFPHKWKKQVIDACNEHGKKRTMFVECLRKIDNKLISLGRDYSKNDQSWLTNAMAQHALRPFRAIITNEAVSNSNSMIYIDDLDEATPEWQTERMSILRTPKNLSESARLLLVASKRLLFIDPYFDPSKKNYRESFEKYFEFTFMGHLPEIIEIHTSNQGHAQELWEKTLCNEFSKLLPACSNIDVYRWENFEDKLHPRFIITEFGGLHYDYGLGADAKSTTVINRLSVRDCQEICKRFKKETSPYTLIDVIKVEGRNT